MILTVEVMKKDKTAFKATDGNWYNQDKKSKPDFSILERGSTVDVENADNWIRAIKLVGSTALPSKSNNGALAPHDSDRDARISRGNAVNGAFAAVFASLSKEMSVEEATTKTLDVVDVVSKYITGGF